MRRPQRSDMAVNWTLDPNISFLNHGSFGACPIEVIKEQRKWQDLIENEPVAFFEDISPDLLSNVRDELGVFLNCAGEDLALVTNATTGVNTILRSLVFNPHDEILVPDHAYQACRNAIDFVAKRWGAKVVTCQIPFPIDSNQQIIDIVLGALTKNTRLALIDTVTSPTGLRMPFEQLISELESNGIQVLLDAAHGPGMTTLDLKKIGASYVTGNCHKWLCSPKGSSFLYVRKDLQHSIHPLNISHGATFPLNGISRFRHEFDWVGTSDISGWLAIPKAITEMQKISQSSWEEIIEKNHRLCIQGRDIICESLGLDAPCPNEMIASISTLKITDSIVKARPLHEPDPLHQVLLSKYGIQVPVWSWPSPEGRYLRISAQLYNHPDEYRYLAECLTKEL